MDEQPKPKGGRPRDTLAEVKRKLSSKTDALSRERAEKRELKAALEKAQRRVERAERVLKERRRQRRSAASYGKDGDVRRAERAERDAESEVQAAKDTVAELRAGEQPDPTPVETDTPAPQPKPAPLPDENTQEKPHVRPIDRIRKPWPWSR